MNFAFDAQDWELRDGARHFLRDRYTAETLRGRVESGASEPHDWAELVELGFVGFLAPEPAGGLAAGEPAFALLAEEAGYVALPEPLIDVAGVAVPLLAKIEHPRAVDLLEQAVSGDCRVLVDHAVNLYLNDCRDEDWILQVGPESVTLLSPDDYSVVTTESIDPLRSLCAVVESSGAVLVKGQRAKALSSATLAYGAVFTAAQLLGLADAMVRMATEYAKERQQFGAAIGSFQAVKHQLADAVVQLEFARPLVYRAAASLAHGDPHTVIHAAHAKHEAGRVAIGAAERAIQVHGAMGYTFEVDLHLWMKRAWALAGVWGDASCQLRTLTSAVFGDGFAHGPAATFADRREINQDWIYE